MISLAPAVAKDGKPIAPYSHNILAVASGKGGVGKTFFSITLTHAIACMGFRPVLFDGDLGLANVDVQLGLMPTRDLGGVIAGRLTLNQARLPYPPGGFDIIAGRSGVGALAALPPSRLALLSHDLAELAQGLDYIVMDLGAGIDRMVRQFANAAGRKLVVATTEPTSLTDAYAFMKITLQDNPKSDLQIVINQARSISDGEKTYLTLLKACETFLKISPSLAGIVRHDRKVIEAIRAQTPLLTKFPGSDAAQDIQNIAQRLIAR